MVPNVAANLLLPVPLSQNKCDKMYNYYQDTVA
jgi:hypothetical protein